MLITFVLFILKEMAHPRPYAMPCHSTVEGEVAAVWCGVVWCGVVSWGRVEPSTKAMPFES